MFIKSIEELDAVRTRCRSMVKKRALASGGMALLPVPGVDIAADVGLLLELLPAVNRQFRLTPEQIDQLDSQLKSFLYGVIKTTGSRVAGQLVTRQLVLNLLQKMGIRLTAKQGLKFIPFAGQAAAVAISGSAMLLIGYAHIEECYAIAKQGLEYKALSGPSTATELSEIQP